LPAAAVRFDRPANGERKNCVAGKKQRFGRVNGLVRGPTVVVNHHGEFEMNKTQRI